MIEIIIGVIGVMIIGIIMGYSWGRKDEKTKREGSYFQLLGEFRDKQGESMRDRIDKNVLNGDDLKDPFEKELDPKEKYRQFLRNNGANTQNTSPMDNYIQPGWNNDQVTAWQGLLNKEFKHGDLAGPNDCRDCGGQKWVFGREQVGTEQIEKAYVKSWDDDGKAVIGKKMVDVAIFSDYNVKLPCESCTPEGIEKKKKNDEARRKKSNEGFKEHKKIKKGKKGDSLSDLYRKKGEDHIADALDDAKD